jgi:hypothetical protein
MLEKISAKEVILKDIKGFVCVCGCYCEYPQQLIWDGGFIYPYKCGCGSVYLLYMRIAHLTKHVAQPAEDLMKLRSLYSDLIKSRSETPKHDYQGKCVLRCTQILERRGVLSTHSPSRRRKSSRKDAHGD